MKEKIKLVADDEYERLARQRRSSIHHVVSYMDAVPQYSDMHNIHAVLKVGGLAHLMVDPTWEAESVPTAIDVGLNHLATIVVVVRDAAVNLLRRPRVHAQKCHRRLLVFGKGKTYPPVYGTGDVWDMRDARNNEERWLKIASRCIGLYQPEEGLAFDRVVMDPWCGSYGVPVAAHRAGMKCIALIHEVAACQSITERLQAETKQLPLSL